MSETKKKQERIRYMNEYGNLTDSLGGILGGDRFMLCSGRLTTPFSKQKKEIYASRWSIENGLIEANIRNDKNMKLCFKSMNEKNLTISDIDTINFFFHNKESLKN